MKNKNNANSPFQGFDATNLTTIFWNAGGLSSAKYTEFKAVLAREKVDLFALVEVGAFTDNVNACQVQGFSIYILPRGRQVASGMILGVKKNITVKYKIIHEMDEDNKIEMVLLRLNHGLKSWKVIVAYNPPRNRIPLQLIENEVAENTIIMGDFNAPSVRWGYRETKDAGLDVEDLIDSSPLEVALPDTPTFLPFRGSPTTPDLVMVHTQQLRNTKVGALESCSGYGHKVILVKIKGAAKTRNLKDVKPRWNFKKANWDKYKSLTNNSLNEKILVRGNPDKSWKNFSQVLIKCAHQAVPRGKIKNYKPFWTEELSKLKGERDSARCKAEMTGDINDLTDLRKKQATLQKEIRSAKKETFKKFISNLNFKQDGVKAHRYLSRLNNENERDFNEPLVRNGTEIFGNKNKAKTLVKHYASVSRTGSAKIRRHKPMAGCLTNEDFNFFGRVFDEHELHKAMNEMRKGKSAGPDNLPTELYINLGDAAKLTLLRLFNISWESGVPADWRKAEIIPVLKKGKPSSDPSSYRPISLTNAVCKILERMIVNRLNTYLEQNHTLHNQQAGFRKNRSTIDQVAYLSQRVKDGFHRCQSTGAVYVDFKAAYDKIWREKLIGKLELIGVKDHMLNWIRSFLSQRHARVKYRDEYSIYVNMKNGLPQGAVISCILFNIMINDLVPIIESIGGVQCLLYADDLIIYATSSQISAIESALNEAMLKLEQWCSENKMIINTQKTVSQLFTLSTKSYPLNVRLGQETLKEECSVKYLGVTLDNKLTWRNHAQDIAASANSRMRLIKRLTGIKWGATEDVLVATYKSYIRPVLEYGAELIATASDPTKLLVDKIQNHALRIITGGAKSTPLLAMEIQTALEPLQVRREKNILILAEKFLRMPDPRWRSHIVPTDRLKTHHSFLKVAEELRNKNKDLQWENRENFPYYQPEVCTIPNKDISIGIVDKKSDAATYALKHHALEKIANNYPENEWVRIYTDGSADKSRKIAGAGFYSDGLFEGKLALSPRATNFDGEIMGIFQAAVKLGMTHTFKTKAVFLSDSLAAINALTTFSSHPDKKVNEAKLQLAKLIRFGWEIKLQWIPSHCGIEGNEIADRLAKEGSLMVQPNPPLSFAEIKREILFSTATSLRSTQEEKASSKSWKSLLTEKVPATLPRHAYVANFRLVTGHDYLRRHLHRLHLCPSPLCPLCDMRQPMDAQHVLTCPEILNHLQKFDDSADNWRIKAKKYWTARTKLDMIPNDTGVG